jgi:hypothetical protein
MPTTRPSVNAPTPETRGLALKDQVLRQDPYPTYTRLRAESPVCRIRGTARTR